ncbi:MAG: hypothetical protein KDA89_19915, partial [Planctomycetaceae bacterium]|nr:hypothetical protein [Planctomycetaceae bacterium]
MAADAMAGADTPKPDPSSGALPATTTAPPELQRLPDGIVDTNVSLFHWPFHRLPLDSTEKLAAKLQSLGVSEAWAGSFEGVLHRDMASVNRRLADECRRFPQLFRPVGTINPLLPDWHRDLRQCVEEYRMFAVRLYPNYHGYPLSDPSLVTLLREASQSGLLVQIAASLEDTRTQHPLVSVADADLRPLTDLMRQVPAARIQLLNHKLRPPLSTALRDTANLFFDTARVDGTDSVPQLARSAGLHRVLLGSHAPFLIPEAS